jgi:PAS domain S-box-containing protein
MDIFYERKLEMNRWLMKARWFYGIGVLAIGVISKLISKSNVNFSLRNMIALITVFYFINIAFILYHRQILKNKTEKSLQILSLLQMLLELVVIVLIIHSAGGVESISFVFFFVPIVSSAFLFNPAGSIITAFICGILFNVIVLLEYYGIWPHINRYGVATLETQNLDIALTKSITTSIFYVITGFYSGYASKMLYTREKLLNEKTEEIIKVNKQLDKKISDLNVARKKTEEAHNKTAAIISNLADPMIVLDKDNKISLLNPASCSVLGFSNQDLGKKIAATDNYSMNNFKGVIRKIYQVKKISEVGKKEIFYEELITNHHEVEHAYKVITAKIIDYKGEYLGVMKIFYNVTREKNLDKMKSEFISIAAHQLRTPLSAIKWSIKLILDEDEGKINEGQKALLTKGYASNERVINLVNDMLNVSRIEEGRFGYSFTPEDFTDALKIVLSTLENEIKERKIQVVVKKPDKLPLVLMDKQKIILVLQNLLENAVKYTPEEGKVEVIIDQGKKHLHVYVKDNGVGVPKEDKKKIFSKFFRASNVIRMQTEGSGLGLFICKNVIETHSGHIKFTSEEGKGTEFSFTLPIGKALKQKSIK